MASMVPVCQITRSGFSSSTHLVHVFGHIRGGLARVRTSVDDLDSTPGSRALSAASSRAG